MTKARDLSQVPNASLGFKNRLINSDMRIDQRNAGASVTPTVSGYTLDRFAAALTQASKFSVQQNAGSVTPPVGFTNYLGATSLSSYSVTSSDFFAVQQKIEGYNIADLSWGTANASPVTLSFWVRSSLTGTFGGAFYNAAGNRSYPFSYTITVANTWEQKSITVAGDTSGTWATNNTTGIFVNFSLGAGSTYSGTVNTWAGALYTQPTGATSVVGTNGATFYITGVQLEKGSTATSFDYRPYGTELALCQRYCFNGSTIGVDSQVIASGMAYNTTQALLVINVPVSMRVVPSLTSNTNLGIWNASGSTIAISTLTITTSANNSTFRLNATVSSAGLVAGNAAVLNTGSPTAGIFILSAEL